jgi:hypothetical protein
MLHTLVVARVSSAAIRRTTMRSHSNRTPEHLRDLYSVALSSTAEAVTTTQSLTINVQ